MATLSTYRTLLSQKLPSTSTNFWDTSKRNQAISDAIRDVVEEYQPASHIKRSTITFASGVVAKPSDYLMMKKLWDPTTETLEYTYVPEDDFDALDDTASYWWTEDYDSSTSTRKLYAKPTTATTLNIRYVRTPVSLATDATESTLEDEWSEVVAYRAAQRLFEASEEIEKANYYKQLGDQSAAKAFQALKKRGGVKQGERLRSRYEKYHILPYNRLRRNG